MALHTRTGVEAVFGVVGAKQELNEAVLPDGGDLAVLASVPGLAHHVLEEVLVQGLVSQSRLCRRGPHVPQRAEKSKL